jgi:hypothetical protein
MRQIAMWLTVIGFALVVFGRIELFRSYTDTLESIRTVVDKTEGRYALPPREHDVTLNELQRSLAEGRAADGRVLSESEQLARYGQLARLLNARIDLLREQLRLTEEVRRLPAQIVQLENRGRIPEGVGFVLAVTGILILCAESIFGGVRRRDPAPTPAPAETASEEAPASRTAAQTAPLGPPKSLI